MKPLTALMSSAIFILILTVSCGGPSEDIVERKNHEWEENKEYHIQRTVYNGPLQYLIDSALASCLIPKDNIQFCDSDDYSISSTRDSNHGTRWVNINRRYLRKVENTATSDGVLFMLFHEIAHHKFGHYDYNWTIHSRSESELSCDRFAGYQMALLDIPFENCEKTIREFANPHESPNYPSVLDRIGEAQRGHSEGVAFLRRIRGN